MVVVPTPCWDAPSPVDIPPRSGAPLGKSQGRCLEGVPCPLCPASGAAAGDLPRELLSILSPGELWAPPGCPQDCVMELVLGDLEPGIPDVGQEGVELLRGDRQDAEGLPFVRGGVRASRVGHGNQRDLRVPQ